MQEKEVLQKHLLNSYKHEKVLQMYNRDSLQVYGGLLVVVMIQRQLLQTMDFVKQ